jgi:hypothetical protein
MAEMKCLVSTIYRQYSTDLCPEMDGYAPGVTSRFEVFCDDTVGKVKVGLSSLKARDLRDIGTRMLRKVHPTAIEVTWTC